MERVVAKAIEIYTGRMCHRISRLIELQITKHPEATTALRELASIVDALSLVFAPGDPEHPGAIRRPHNAGARTSTTNLYIDLIARGLSNAEVTTKMGCHPSYPAQLRKKYANEIEERRNAIGNLPLGPDH